ncbi:hypothetical protein [Hydrogenophaga sp. ZJX-1]|uniref:hypothetical protein n=1 Tax=Hydrogenophaga sp. ZJX-1 TaxID=3404778 RepID=UPI003B28B767
MTQVQSKGDGKASSAVLVGVGVAAGAAVLHSADASVSSEIDQTSSGSTQSASIPSLVTADEAMAGGSPPEPVQISADTPYIPAAESATNIEQLVEAYLGENVDASLSLEALSEAELQDHLSESELQALISQPGVQVAQSEGGGGFGFLDGGGLGTAGVIGGVVVGGVALNDVLDDDDSNGTV